MSASKVTSDKLKDLECLFTWEVKIDDINDLTGIPEKLLDRVKYCPRRYHATYYNILAFVSHLEKKTDMALEYLAKAEAVLKEEKRDEVDFLVTYSSFAWLYHHLGNLEDTKTYLGKVKSIGEGRDITVEAEKGWSFLRLGVKFYPRAKESFQRALEAKPDSVPYNVGYAIVLYRLEELVRKDGKTEPKDSLAAKHLERALDLDPTDAEVMVLLALKYQTVPDTRSKELIHKALTKCPDMPQVIRYAGTYFRREKSTAESLKILKEAAKRAPTSSFVYHQMGLCYRQDAINMRGSDNTSQVKTATMESIRLFRKAVELKPSNTYAWVHLAEAYAENRKADKAELIFTRLLSDDSLTHVERQHCHTKYGLFLMYQRKDYARAVEQFKNAYRIRIDSNDRTKAKDKLEMIASRWSGRTGQESEIYAFLLAVDAEDKQDNPVGIATAQADVRLLAESFKTKMTF